MCWSRAGQATVLLQFPPHPCWFRPGAPGVQEAGPDCLQPTACVRLGLAVLAGRARGSQDHCCPEPQAGSKGASGKPMGLMGPWPVPPCQAPVFMPCPHRSLRGGFIQTPRTDGRAQGLQSIQVTLRELRRQLGCLDPSYHTQPGRCCPCRVRPALPVSSPHDRRV